MTPQLVRHWSPIEHGPGAEPVADSYGESLRKTEVRGLNSHDEQADIKIYFQLCIYFYCIRARPAGGRLTGLPFPSSTSQWAYILKSPRAMQKYSKFLVLNYPCSTSERLYNSIGDKITFIYGQEQSSIL